MNRDGSLELKTVWNLRDIGGYATSSGKVTRSGLVFRSGDLSRLDSKDASAILPLGLRTVVDLRDPVAWEKRPDRLDGLSVNLLRVDLTTRVHIELRDRWETHHLSESESLEYIRSITASIALERSDAIKDLFRYFLQPDVFPLLMHCSAGKDRTGIVTAMLLFALDVPEETVYSDYMLSNDYLTPFHETHVNRPGWEHTGPLWEARREYLGEALSAVRDSYGSIDTYLERAIGLTDEMRTKLKALLLRSSEQ